MESSDHPCSPKPSAAKLTGMASSETEATTAELKQTKSETSIEEANQKLGEMRIIASDNECALAPIVDESVDPPSPDKSAAKNTDMESKNGADSAESVLEKMRSELVSKDAELSKLKKMLSLRCKQVNEMFAENSANTRELVKYRESRCWRCKLQ